MRPKVAIFILCSTERTGWINPYLCLSLIRLQQDSRLDVNFGMIIDKTPVEHARNLCISNARARGADVCVQIDNDMTLPSDFAGILHAALTTGKAVVSLRCGTIPAEDPKMIPEDDGEPDGNFRKTGRGGGGVLIISSEVWRIIPNGPWFRWLANEDETLSRHCSEDYFFCHLVQNNGLTVWTHRAEAGHLKTSDATRWISRVIHLQNEIAKSEGREMPGFVAW